MREKIDRNDEFCLIILLTWWNPLMSSKNDIYHISTLNFIWNIIEKFAFHFLYSIKKFCLWWMKEKLSFSFSIILFFIAAPILLFLLHLTSEAALFMDFITVERPERGEERWLSVR